MNVGSVSQHTERHGQSSPLQTAAVQCWMLNLQKLGGATAQKTVFEMLRDHLSYVPNEPLYMTISMVYEVLSMRLPIVCHINSPEEYQLQQPSSETGGFPPEQ